MGESVRARLLNLARARNEDFQLVLLRYVNERFLYRLSVSPQRARFVLKGATLFAVWTGVPHRATRDLDLGSPTEASEAGIRAALVEILGAKVVDDGVQFDSQTLVVAAIREDQSYGGIRATLTARVATARVRVQIDVGFGDAITPAAEAIDIPVLLDFPTPTLRVYPRETVVAEKLDAMVQLGLANSRMKDFFDLAVLARQFPFDGAVLVAAVKATFRRRKTPITVAVPVALSAEFANDRGKAAQWRAFLSKTGASTETTLPEVVAEIATFLLEVIEAARSDTAWTAKWSPAGPWRK